MLRTVPVILLFLISLLSLFPAPSYHTWLLAVGVTEYPWVFALITIAVLLLGYLLLNYPLWAMGLGLAALVIFASPLFRASSIADTLPAELNAAFGGKPDKKAAFSAISMFSGSQIVEYNAIEYKKTEKQPLTLDFYRGRQAGSRPCILVIHGGSWSSGNSQQLPELNSELALMGYHVASLNYRKAPAYQNPAPVEDIRDALNFLRRQAETLKIDTSNFVLLGRSAGGQIALLAAYSLKDTSIKGVIDFYGPADMVWGYSLPSNPLVMDSRGVMERYLGGTYSQVPKNYEASSPILFADQQSPPTLMIHGSNDVLVSPLHSTKLQEKLKDLGVKNYLLKLPWGVHGFDFNLNGPGGQLSTYAVNYFLKTIVN